MDVFVGLGGNLGCPQDSLCQAARLISGEPGFSSFRVSSLYRSAPVDSFGPDYINAVAGFSSDLEPQDILKILLQFETLLGRTRPLGVHNAPRTIDCDLLLAGDAVVDTEFLTLPHPRMHERAFVLLPLLELSPGVVIPGRGAARDFLDSVRDQRIEKYKSAEDWFYHRS